MKGIVICQITNLKLMNISVEGLTMIEFIEYYSNFICYIFEKNRISKEEKSLDDLDIANYKYFLALTLYHYKHFNNFYLENFISYINNDFNIIINFYENIDNEINEDSDEEMNEEIEVMKDIYHYFKSISELNDIKESIFNDLIKISPILFNKFNQERKECLQLIENITNENLISDFFEFCIPKNIKSYHKKNKLNNFLNKISTPILFEANDEDINPQFQNILLKNKINEASTILNEKIFDIKNFS